MLLEWFSFAIVAALGHRASPKSAPAPPLPPSCDSKIYCQGEVLDVVQMSRFYDDSKTFVDMSTLFAPDEVLQHFEDMMRGAGDRPTRRDLAEFLAQNFAGGGELEDWTPPDHRPSPAFLRRVSDARVRAFARDVVAIWPKLGRRVVEDVRNNSDRHSLIYVPNGFVVPGGRFREYYYWDSYWILRGLLVSEMRATARGMLENFLHLVEAHGFVPNGGRVYYLNRSQPPLLTKMAREYFDATNDEDWIFAHVATLAKELRWWVENQFVAVLADDGETYRLATYASASLGPRPESYREDVEASLAFPDAPDRQQLFNELKGAAQSGWDFSTRWIFDENGGTSANISFTATSRAIPVDLNAILCGAFADISELYGALGRTEEQKSWADRADALKGAIRAVLWHPEDGVWYDYDLALRAPRRAFAASNLAPLWTNAYEGTERDGYGSKAAEYLRRERIDEYQGGIPSTKVHSNEQWDFPNAWPPLQAIVVHGLRSTGVPAAVDMAEEFAQRWIAANMIGFEEEGTLFEKYDAVTPGAYGGGGEYRVQTGFGWSNGVVLDFINTYPDTRVNRKGRPMPAKKSGKHRQ